MKEIKLLSKILASMAGLIIGLIIMTYGLRMISSKSTIENYAGLFVLLLLISSASLIALKIYKSIQNKLKPKNNEKTI